MKKFTAVLMAIWMVATGVVCLQPAVQAATGTQVRIEEVDYEGNGRVEVEFEGKVKYKNLKLTVKDDRGASYKTSIRKRDNDELDFVIAKVKKGRKYTFTISGVKPRSGGSYGTVKGSVVVPAAGKVQI